MGEGFPYGDGSFYIRLTADEALDMEVRDARRGRVSTPFHLVPGMHGMRIELRWE